MSSSIGPEGSKNKRRKSRARVAGTDRRVHERHDLGDRYDGALAKATGWTCLSLLVLVVSGGLAASVLAVSHGQFLVLAGLPGVAGLSWVLAHTVLRCAGVPKTSNRVASAPKHALPNGPKNRPVQKPAERRRKRS